MAKILDAFIVTLGLNATGFTKGQKDANKGLKDVGDQANKTGKTVSASTKAMTDAMNSLKRELLAVTALFTTLSGIRKFAIETIQSTAALSRLSSNLGLSKTELAEWQLAAKHAGGSMDGMTVAIEKANDAVGAARVTGDWSALSRSQFYQADATKIKTGTDLLLEQADALKRLRDAGRSEGDVLFAAHDMGISTDLYNLLKNGRSGVQSQLSAQAGRAKAMANLADDAEKLRKSFDDIFNILQTVGIKTITHFLGAIQKFANYLDTPEFQEKVDRFIDGMDQLGRFVWKWLHKLGIIEDTPAVRGSDVMSAQGVSGALAASGLPGTNNEASTRSMNELMSMGWTKAQAAGMVGSLKQENSNFDPTLRNGKGMVGIAQWDQERQRAYRNYPGNPSHKTLEQSSRSEQLAYMNYELREGKLQFAGAAIAATNNPADAAKAHRKYYEKPGELEANDAARVRYANQVFGGGNAAAIARARPAKANSSVASTNTTSSQVTINGPINVVTQATDANGIARGMRDAVKLNMANMNTALQ